jgi:7-cyano-7-deazaguanine synthase
MSIVLACVESLLSLVIFIGVNAVDYSGYPDCRPEYIAAFEQMANLATKAAIEGAKLRIHAPLMNLSKAEIIRQGMLLGLDYSLTVSCYQADESGLACGVCDSCRLRRRGFESAGVPDVTRYKK